MVRQRALCSCHLRHRNLTRGTSRSPPVVPGSLPTFAQDLTVEEFRSMYLMPKGTIKTNTDVPLANVSGLPKAPSSFDWRTHKSAVTPVKDQGQCGCVMLLSPLRRHTPRPVVPVVCPSSRPVTLAVADGSLASLAALAGPSRQRRTSSPSGPSREATP